jgi:hypothetical protein
MPGIASRTDEFVRRDAVGFYRPCRQTAPYKVCPLIDASAAIYFAALGKLAAS